MNPVSDYTQGEDPAHRKHSSLTSSERYWSLFAIGARLAIVIHVLFVPLFYFIGSTLLAVFNVGSIILFIFCLALLKREHYSPAIFLAWLEIIGHAVLATRVVGWEGGFHYYLLIIIPLIFATVSQETGRKIILMTLICLIYILMDNFLRDAVPLTLVNEDILSLVRYANVTITFAFLGYVAFFYINTVDKAENRLFWHATTDPLTGLFNRRHQVDVIEYERKQFKRSGKSFSFILADIDDFKTINDIHGHDTGDRILIIISNLLIRTLREQDSTARWGGEEYLILLPNTPLDQAVEIAERIKQAITSDEININGSNISLTITMGISEYRDGESIDACITRADEALYRGKKNGKDRVEIEQL